MMLRARIDTVYQSKDIMATLEIPEGWYDSYISGLYASLLDSYDEETAKITFNAIVANHATQEEIDALDELLMEVELHLHSEDYGFLDNVEEARRLFEEKACNLAEVICLNPKIMRLICGTIKSRSRIARLNYALVENPVDEDDDSVRYCTWNVFVKMTEKQRSLVKRIWVECYCKIDWEIAGHVKQWATSCSGYNYFIHRHLDWLFCYDCFMDDHSHEMDFYPMLPETIRCHTLITATANFSEVAPRLEVVNLNVTLWLNVIDFFVPPTIEVLRCEQVILTTSLRGEALMAKYREWRSRFKMAKFYKVYVRRDSEIDGFNDVGSNEDIEIDSNWSSVNDSIDKVALTFL